MIWKSSSASTAARASSLLLCAVFGACAAGSTGRLDYAFWTAPERKRLETEARVRFLMKDLTNPSEPVRDAAVEALARIGAPADPPLRAAIRSGSPEEALSAFDVFRRREDPGPLVLPVTHALRLNRYARVRAEAGDLLGAWGDRDATPSLIAALQKDKDPRVRTAAARALGRLMDPPAEPALRKAADDASPRVRMEAVRALVRLKIADARTFFMEIWRRVPDSDVDTQLELIRALEAFRPLSDRRFVGGRLGGSASPRVRAAAARLLGLSPDPAVRVFLMEALSDPDTRVGRAAHHALEEQTGTVAPEGMEPVGQVLWWNEYFGR